MSPSLTRRKNPKNPKEKQTNFEIRKLDCDMHFREDRTRTKNLVRPSEHNVSIGCTAHKRDSLECVTHFSEFKINDNTFFLKKSRLSAAHWQYIDKSQKV